MARRAVLSLAALLGAVFIVASLSGCFLLGGPGVSGYVFDASSGNPIANATVTISDNIGDSYTTGTNSSGNWFVSSPHEGTYTVSVSGSGFYFTTPVYAVVYTNGSSVTAQTVAGISSATYSGTSSASYLFILVWNGTPSPLDLHMTIPKGNSAASGTPASGNPESPTWIPSQSLDQTIWNAGFGPPIGSNSTGAGRWDCNASNTNPFGNGTLQLISNVQGGGPVTIDLTGGVPISTGWTVTDDNLNLFPSTATQFEGVAELYIDSPTASLANLGNAVVYVVRVGKYGGTVTPMGAYAINQDSSGQTGAVLSTETVSILRINILDTAFQIVPDFRAVGSGATRSVAGTKATPQILNVLRK